MQLIQKTGLAESSDQQLMAEKLNMNNSHVLELGCGTAFVTRKLAEAYPSAHITAAEVDRIQHDKNLQIDDLPNVDFILAGMQDIPLPDGSIDLVIMLKSLHHVPTELLLQGFQEIHRVLKKNGRRAPFDRDKLERSMAIALRKRPVEPERRRGLAGAPRIDDRPVVPGDGSRSHGAVPRSVHGGRLQRRSAHR